MTPLLNKFSDVYLYSEPGANGHRTLIGRGELQVYGDSIAFVPDPAEENKPKSGGWFSWASAPKKPSKPLWIHAYGKIRGGCYGPLPQGNGWLLSIAVADASDVAIAGPEKTVRAAAVIINTHCKTAEILPVAGREKAPTKQQPQVKAQPQVKSQVQEKAQPQEKPQEKKGIWPSLISKKPAGKRCKFCGHAYASGDEFCVECGAIETI